MSFEEIMKSLRAGKYEPVYFLHGTESYFIDAVSGYIERHALSEEETAFNQTILYGKETDHKTVVDAARRYPMMAPRQVVILKEAQEMRTLKDLQSYIEKPLVSTVFVVCYKHKRFSFDSAFGKALKKHAVVFESKSLYDNQVPDWVRTYLQQKKLGVKPAAAALIAEYLGTELSKVANELDKLVINLPEGTEITERHIEEQIGISKDYNVFELQKALSTKDVLKANRIVNYFAANPKRNPTTVVIGSLYNYFSKVYLVHFFPNASDAELAKALELRSSFFLKDYKVAARNFNRAKSEQIIALLKEYDLKSKGVNYNSTGKPEGELLREMVWRVLN
jgi:DNA polymerase III subunit delta